MHKKISILVFTATLTGLIIFAVIFMPKERNAFSETENRYLAAFPAFSLVRVKDKKFMDGFQKWVNDHFIGRTNWIVLRNKAEQSLGKTEINGVFIRDGRMMQVWKDYNEKSVDRNLAAMESFAERYPDVFMYFMLAPTSQEIYSNTLPKNSPVGNQGKFISYCYDKLPGIAGIDIENAFIINREQYIYYRTDHHWTSYGAFLAYKTAASIMGYHARSLNDFNIEHASYDFRGTLYSKTLDKTIESDVIDFYTLTEGEPPITVCVNTSGDAEIKYDTIYFREFLNKKDKYSSFLGSNAPLITIRNNAVSAGNARSLLIFKDSYAHSLIPFLTKHYKKIVVADMRYINIDYNELFDVNDFDQVLFLYNVITFSEDTEIFKLKTK